MRRLLALVVPLALGMGTGCLAHYHGPSRGYAASVASVAVLALLVLAGLLGSQEIPENIVPLGTTEEGALLALLLSAEALPPAPSPGGTPGGGGAGTPSP